MKFPISSLKIISFTRYIKYNFKPMVGNYTVANSNPPATLLSQREEILHFVFDNII